MMTARIAATDQHPVSTVASHVGRRHRLGLEQRFGIVHGVAYEGNAKYPALPQERYARRLVLELADIPGGYAWVFPKGDHANVGVGGWQSEGPKLREHLQRACEAQVMAQAGGAAPTRRRTAGINSAAMAFG